MAALAAERGSRIVHSTTNYNTGVISSGGAAGRPKTPISLSFPRPLSFFFSRPSSCQSVSQIRNLKSEEKLFPLRFRSIDRQREGALLPSSALERRGGGPKRALGRRSLSSFGGPHFLLLPFSLLLQFAAPNSFSSNLQGVQDLSRSHAT